MNYVRKYGSIVKRYRTIKFTFLKKRNSMNPVGFWSYNRFKKDVRKLKQIYDFTLHLYLREHEEIRKKLESQKSIGEKKKVSNLTTPIGEINHNLNTLFYHTKTNYPNTLRQLLLINLVTSLEVYFTNLVREISKRDLNPFMVNEKANLFKNQILNYSTIAMIENDIIENHLRSLTNGGIDETCKFFEKYFGINLKNISTDFNKIKEVHERRHLFVHRNGKCDSKYTRNFPEFGLKPGEKMPVNHDYIINAFEIISEFGKNINDASIQNFPYNKRKLQNKLGDKKYVKEEVKLLIEIEGFNSFNLREDLLNKSINSSNDKLRDFVMQCIQIEKRFQIYVSAEQENIDKIMQVIKKNEDSTVLITTEIKF